MADAASAQATDRRPLTKEDGGAISASAARSTSVGNAVVCVRARCVQSRKKTRWAPPSGLKGEWCLLMGFVCGFVFCVVEY